MKNLCTQKILILIFRISVKNPFALFKFLSFGIDQHLHEKFTVIKCKNVAVMFFLILMTTIFLPLLLYFLPIILHCLCLLC